MEIFVNELSIHGQFQSTADFHAAFERLTAMRKTAKGYNQELYCSQSLLAAKPLQDMAMQQALQGLGKDRVRAAMSWLTKGSSLWGELRRHDPDNDDLECRGELVTDSAVGEAAFRVLEHNAPCWLVSITPSNWDFSPLEVVWRREDEGLDNRSAALENWLDAAALENGLRAAQPPFQSWDDLRKALTGGRFENLVFSDDCFEPLSKHSFNKSSAKYVQSRLGILDQLAGAFDKSGTRTREGHEIHRKHFEGDRAWFSDSSDKEKSNFAKELTFPHPGRPEETLFCPWHGKVNYTGFPLRLHHSWPVKAGEPVYVVYVGPKITRR